MTCGHKKCQGKGLESIQLHACRYILCCSVTTCDEPVCADSGLETLNCRRAFCRLKTKQYCKIMCMNDKRLPVKLLANKWISVECRGHPRKSWVAQARSLSDAVRI